MSTAVIPDPNIANLQAEVAELRQQFKALFLLLGKEQQLVDQEPTVRGFCRRKRISKAHYYVLRREGRGPRETDVSSKGDRSAIRITPEAEHEWDRAREIERAALEGEKEALAPE